MPRTKNTKLICLTCEKEFIYKGKTPRQKKYCDSCLTKRRRERSRAYMRQYYQDNREKMLERVKIYHQKNRDKERSRGLFRRMEVILLKGGKCERCGFDNAIALTFHHIEGMKERRQDYMKKDYDLSKVQLLCANCHEIEHKRNCDFYSNNTVFTGVQPHKH